MATKQITVERFSVVSAKPFTEVVRAIEAQVGHPDIKQFYEAIQEAADDQELQRVVNDAVGPLDLMEFMSLDHGVVLRRELGPGAPNVVRLPQTRSGYAKVDPAGKLLFEGLNRSPAGHARWN